MVAPAPAPALYSPQFVAKNVTVVAVKQAKNLMRNKIKTYEAEISKLNKAKKPMPKQVKRNYAKKLKRNNAKGSKKSI